MRQTGDLKMPKDGSKLDEQQIADLVEWVKMGAPWDPNEVAEPLAISVSSAAAASSVGEEFFENKVRPDLRERLLRVSRRQGYVRLASLLSRVPPDEAESEAPQSFPTIRKRA